MRRAIIESKIFDFFDEIKACQINYTCLGLDVILFFQCGPLAKLSLTLLVYKVVLKLTFLFVQVRIHSQCDIAHY